MKQDQSARAYFFSGINKDERIKLKNTDEQRRNQVADILQRGELHTAQDYYHAAMIYQHGGSIDSIRMAYSLATLSSMLDPANKSAKWLSAAAWDRMMMTLGKPQWYGTQFQCPYDTNACELYVIDESAVTDEDRKNLGVPTLTESRARAKLMTKERRTHHTHH